MAGKRSFRSTVTAPRVEVGVRAIPVLPPGAWALLSPEHLSLGGAAPKDLLYYGPRDRPTARYIAKKPRKFGPRECVTEALLSAVGRRLPVKLAGWRLVRLPHGSGAADDVRFLSKVFLKHGEEQLVHGVEIAARYLDAHEDEVRQVFNLDDRKQERSFWTVSFVLDALEDLAAGRSEYEHLRDGFARMLAYDAFVGTADRHPENWGIVENIRRPAPRCFAPLYDTARGLFGTHREAKLVEVDGRGKREALIRKYAEGSYPIFGWDGMPGAKLNHFKVLERALREHGEELGLPIRQVIGAVNLGAIDKSLRLGFSRIITKRRLDYILDLLQFRYDRLKLILAETM